MKNIIIYTFLTVLLVACGNDDSPKKQVIPTVTETSSNCVDSTNQLKAVFEQKASILALKYTLEKGTNFKDSTQIDEELKNQILSAFYGIKQAKDLKNKDISLALEIYPYPSMSTINLFLDKNSTVATAWKNNYTNSSNDTINQLLKDFDLKVSAYNENHAKGHKVTLTSSKLWNTQVILDKFLKVNAVITGNNEEITSIIDDIQYSKEDKIQKLLFIDRSVNAQKNYTYQIDENCVVKVLE